MSGSAQTVTPLSTESFLSTLGADTHIAYTDGGYANIPNVIGDLQYLGITQVRDGITNGQNGSAPLSSYIAMAQAGIHFTFIIETSSTADLQYQLSLINQVEVAVPGSVTAIEGPNEINNEPVTYNGVTGLQGALNLQQDIYAAVQADPLLAGVPVDYFTGYGAYNVGLGPDPITTPGLANDDTQHPYPQFGQAPAYWVARANALTNTNAATAPAVYTETGYSTNGVSPDVQAKYTLDLLMDTAQEGIGKTYLYDLLDGYAPGSPQGDDGFGLFDSTGAAKPAANAIHNLTTLLQDSGANAATFQPTPLTYSISGLPSDGNSMVMETSGGTYVIAVWAEPQIWNNSTSTEIAAPTENVTVTLPQSFASIQVFDPLTGTSAIATSTNSNSVTIAVTDHPILIEVSNMPATTTPTDTLVLGLSEDAYQGDALFTVSVDGRQLGGAQSVTALHSSGQSEYFTFTGAFGPGTHTVAVSFLNDAYGGSASADRNLYIDSATLDGAITVINGSQLWDGAYTFALQTPTVNTADSVTQTPAVVTPPPTVTMAAPVEAAGSTVVTLSGTVTGASGTTVEIYNGTTALGQATLDNAGGWSFTGNFAAGSYDFGAVATDPTGNTATSGDPAFTVTNPLTIAFAGGVLTSVLTRMVSDSTPVTIASTGPDTLVLAIAEDAYLGDAQFTISVNGQQIGGVQTATALHGAGQSQDFTLHGNFGSGPVSVSVDYLNDALAIATTGAVVGDRNLYADSITLNGATTVENSALFNAGTLNYTVQGGTTSVVTPPPPDTPPSVSITAPAQSFGTAIVTLTGTVTGASGTIVEIYNGTTALGAATLNGAGGWSFTSSLTAGSYSFDAVATDPAGNTATAADPAFTVTAPASPDIVLATVSTGSGTTQQSVDLTSATPISGTYVATSAAGSIGASPLVLFNWDPATQLAGFLAAQAAGGASIAAIGDSTTRGFGSATNGWTQLSYPVELAQALTQDGVAAQSDNFLGQGQGNATSTDNRVTLLGNASYPFIIDAGGQVIETTAAGDGFDFTLNSPADYDRVTISYIDIGNGSVNISVDGGPVLGTLQFGNTGNTLTQTIDIPAGLYSELTVVSNSSNPTYIQGASFSSSTNPAVQVYNAGIGGWDSNSANTSYANGALITGSASGFGQTAGTAALQPSLALIDLGINDIAGGLDTTAQTVANISAMITTLRAAGSDVIIVIPQPFSNPAYATELPALRSALEALAIAQNVPVIDLSATYGDNFSALYAAGLMSDSLHPDATLYADIGSQIAALLTNTITNTSSGGAYVSVSASANNATIAGTATVNTLTGTGANDTYVMNATDQSDTIINGTSSSTAPSGQLDINAATHSQLWFEQSGNNLVVDVLGATQQAIIQNWYASTGQQLAEIIGIDGYKLDSSLQSLVQAMASFSAANPAFNPETTTHTTLTDPYFSTALAATAATAWHV